MTYPSQAYQGRLGFDRTPAGFGRAQGYLRQESMGDFARRLNLADEERFKRMRRAYGEQAGAMKRRMGEMMFGQGIGQLARRLEVPRGQPAQQRKVPRGQPAQRLEVPRGQPVVPFDYEKALENYKRMELDRLGKGPIISGEPMLYSYQKQPYYKTDYKGWY